MTEHLIQWSFFISSIILLPILTVSTIRKTKARLQNRIGPRWFQPLFDLCRLFGKDETISNTMSGVFRLSTVACLSIMILIAWLTPWLAYKPWNPNADLFLILYLIGLARLLTLLGALDAGSAFGAFGASREATLSLLVEPAALLGFAALGVIAGSSDLRVIFSLSNNALETNPIVWILVGSAILLASLVELSRMPVDDPTTHLELTMVHEAMILEASGRNLALIEFTHSLHMSILFGLSAECYLRAIPSFWSASTEIHMLASVFGILLLAMLVGTFESIAVKLQWRKVPEFIAYSMTMSLLAAFIASAGGILK